MLHSSVDRPFITESEDVSYHNWSYETQRLFLDIQELAFENYLKNFVMDYVVSFSSNNPVITGWLSWLGFIPEEAEQ